MAGLPHTSKYGLVQMDVLQAQNVHLLRAKVNERLLSLYRNFTSCEIKKVSVNYYGSTEIADTLFQDGDWFSVIFYQIDAAGEETYQLPAIKV